MNQNEMIQSLRAEITKLQRVLELLLEQSSDVQEDRRPGRPKGSGNRATSFNPEEFAPKKRTMSAEGKARIAAAQKKRWAAQKAASPDRTAPRKAASTKRSSKTVLPNSANKVAPKVPKKSAGAGKRAGSAQAKTRVAPAKRTTVVANKSAGKKTVAKKTSRHATRGSAKQAAPPAPEPQSTE